MNDDERELSGDEASKALTDFVQRGHRAQAAADLIVHGFDIGKYPDRTVWRCTCGYGCDTAAQMLQHQRTHGE